MGKAKAKQTKPKTTPEVTSWMLRIDDGAEFGPVDQETLAVWAQQGRISPGNQISRGDGNWIPASDLEELEMHWMVELSDGSEFGPLNIRALEDLLNNGAVMPNARMTNLLTQESTTPRSRHSEIFFGTPVEFDETEALNAALLAETRRHSDDLNAHLAEFEECLDQTASLLDSHRQELAGKRARQAELQSALTNRNETIEKLRGEIDEQREDRQNAVAQVQELEEKLHSLEDQLIEAKAAASAADEQTRTLHKTIEQLRIERDRLVRERNEAVADRKAACAERDQAQSELTVASGKLRTANERAAGAEKEAQAALDRVEDLQQDLRDTQEKALDAQKLRQVVDQEQHQLTRLAEQNRDLKERLEATTQQYDQEVTLALKKIEALNRTVSELESVEVVTPELVREEPDSPNSPDMGEMNALDPLQDLEAQAQRELETWHRSRKA